MKDTGDNQKGVYLSFCVEYVEDARNRRWQATQQGDLPNCTDGDNQLV